MKRLILGQVVDTSQPSSGASCGSKLKSMLKARAFIVSTSNRRSSVMKIPELFHRSFVTRTFPMEVSDMLDIEGVLATAGVSNLVERWPVLAALEWTACSRSRPTVGQLEDHKLFAARCRRKALGPATAAARLLLVVGVLAASRRCPDKRLLSGSTCDLQKFGAHLSCLLLPANPLNSVEMMISANMSPTWFAPHH